MTGYGKAMMENQEIMVSCEMRALNGKFLDLDIRIPKFLMELDMEIRKNLSQKLLRGSISVFYNISTKPSVALQEVRINEALAADYHGKLNALQGKLNSSHSDLFAQIIAMPDVVQTTDAGLSDEAKKLILECSLLAADNLNEFRKTEGQALYIDLLNNIEFIEEKVQKVIALEPKRKDELRNKIYSNLAEHIKNGEIDESRFEQEVLYYLDKWDIAEEKTRLSQHLTYFKDTMNVQQCGKKLYFISQEMVRESNTMGVKSNFFEIQQHMVEVKEKLESIKEQILNVL